MSALATLGTGRGRGVALALLGGVLLSFAALAVLPHLWSLELGRSMQVQTTRAKQLENQALRLGVSQARLAALSDPNIARSMLLGGQTAGLNGARLQRQVTEIAEAAGLNPQSLRIAEPEAWEHGLRNIRIEIGMRASLGQIHSFLYNIETRRPLMFVEALTLARPQGDEDGLVDSMLDVTMIVRGIALAETGK